MKQLNDNDLSNKEWVKNYRKYGSMLYWKLTTNTDYRIHKIVGNKMQFNILKEIYNELSFKIRIQI
jgi:hypothetical protein